MKYCFLLSALAFLFVANANAQSTIEAGRAIDVRIQGVPSGEMERVNNTYPVSEGGYIRMPFIGNIRAAGLSPTSLATNIESSYRAAKIYTNPTVQVFASSDETKTSLMLTIGGYVGSPGPTPYTRGMTLYGALQAAGGANEFGSMYRVRLIRDGKLTEYDLTKTETKGILVKPNDTIEVPQKNIIGR